MYSGTDIPTTRRCVYVYMLMHVPYSWWSQWGLLPYTEGGTMCVLYVCVLCGITHLCTTSNVTQPHRVGANTVHRNHRGGSVSTI